MSWTFALKNVQHHRDKAVHGVGVLASSVLKVVWAQRVKGSECQRVAIN